MRVGGSVQQWVVESEETVPLMEPEGGACEPPLMELEGGARGDPLMEHVGGGGA